jgi:hypothetical protein
MSLKKDEGHEIAEACFELKKEFYVKKNKFTLAGSGLYKGARCRFLC